VIRLPLVLAVLRREVREIAGNRWLLLGIAIPPPLLVVVPLAMGVFMTDEALPPEFIQLITAQRPEWAAFSARELTAAFAVQQFLPFFLILPAYLPLAIATYSIIGEKQSRSLEAVLATPIRTTELLAGKTIAALVPGVLTGWLTYLLFVAAASVVYGPNLFGVVSDGSWIAATLALGPAIGLVSTLAGVIVSARVNDPRLAQQVGGVVIVPIVGIALLQATGILLVGAIGYLLLAAALAAICVAGLRLGAWLFDREAILTRWK
jgi:ABC-2 type transport system permease protein